MASGENVVKEIVVEEKVVGGPVIKRALIERSANEKTVVYGLVTKETGNKKLEVDSRAVKWSGVEDQ